MIIDRRRDDLGNFNSYVSMMPALNLQEARLKRLKHRMKVNYEPSRSEHRVSFMFTDTVIFHIQHACLCFLLRHIYSTQYIISQGLGI